MIFYTHIFNTKIFQITIEDIFKISWTPVKYTTHIWHYICDNKLTIVTSFLAAYTIVVLLHRSSLATTHHHQVCFSYFPLFSMQLSFTILDEIIYYSIFFEDLQVTIVASWINFDLVQVLNPTTLISVYDIIDALAGTDYVDQAINNGSGPINVTTIESYADTAVNITAESIEFGAG